MTELTQVHHGGTTAAPEVTAYLAAAGVQGIPAPLPTRTSTLWSDRAGKRLSLTPWIPGARAAETGLTTAQWTSYGALLADVHAQQPPALEQLLPSLNPVSERLLALTRQLDHRLTTQAPVDEVAAELTNTWQSHRETIHTLLDLFQRLEDAERRRRPARLVSTPVFAPPCRQAHSGD